MSISDLFLWKSTLQRWCVANCEFLFDGLVHWVTKELNHFSESLLIDVSGLSWGKLKINFRKVHSYASGNILFEEFVNEVHAQTLTIGEACGFELGRLDDVGVKREPIVVGLTIGTFKMVDDQLVQVLHDFWATLMGLDHQCSTVFNQFGFFSEARACTDEAHVLGEVQTPPLLVSDHVASQERHNHSISVSWRQVHWISDVEMGVHVNYFGIWHMSLHACDGSNRLGVVTAKDYWKVPLFNSFLCLWSKHCRGLHHICDIFSLKLVYIFLIWWKGVLRNCWISTSEGVRHLIRNWDLLIFDREFLEPGLWLENLWRHLNSILRLPSCKWISQNFEFSYAVPGLTHE